ncbi:hypothetical protein CR513_51922, partial [Mucuna pruriens]
GRKIYGVGKKMDLMPTYNFLNSHSVDGSFDSVDGVVLEKFWKGPTPLKLPTKSALFKHGINLDGSDLTCYFCKSAYEETNHLSLSCIFSSQVWVK